MSSLAVSILLFMVCSGATAQQPNIPVRNNVPNILFSDVNIVDVKNGIVLNNMDLFIKDDVIAGISKHRKEPKKQQGLVIIPGKGKYIMPGLVDCHTHIIFKEELVNYLTNGITTVFSLGSPVTVLDYRRQVKEKKITGPDIFAGCMLDAIREDWGGIVLNKMITSDTAVTAVMNEVVNEGWDFVKVYNNLSIPEFDAVMRIARSKNIPVIGHGVRAPGLEHALSSGMGMVSHAEEYVYAFFKNGMEENRIADAVSLTKKYGSFVCPNLYTFRQIAKQWGDSLAFARIVEEQGDRKNYLHPFTLKNWFHNNPYLHRNGSVDTMYAFLVKLTFALHKAGVPLVAGTDSPIIPGCFPGLSLAEDLRLLTQAGLSNADAIKCATMNAGLFIQKYRNNVSKLGLIEVEYQADLLLLDKNPLENIQHVRNIAGVMSNGTWYPANGFIQLKRDAFSGQE